MQFNFAVSTKERAVKLWKNFGFEIIGHITEEFQHPKQGFVPALIMYKNYLTSLSIILICLYLINQIYELINGANFPTCGKWGKSGVTLKASETDSLLPINSGTIPVRNEVERFR